MAVYVYSAYPPVPAVTVNTSNTSTNASMSTANSMDIHCLACGHTHSPNRIHSSNSLNNLNDSTNTNTSNSRHYYKNTSVTQPLVSLNYLTQMKNVHKDIADCV